MAIRFVDAEPNEGGQVTLGRAVPPRQDVGLRHGDGLDAGMGHPKPEPKPRGREKPLR